MPMLTGVSIKDSPTSLETTTEKQHCRARQAKLLRDRTFSLYHEKRLRGKVCGGIVVSGGRGTANALSVLNMFFLGHEMRPVSNGISAHGDVSKDQRAKLGAHNLGLKITETIYKQK